MRARICVVVVAISCLPVAARAQATPWTPDSGRAVQRTCAALRYPDEKLSESLRDRRATDAFRRAEAAGDAKSGVECLLARADIRALVGDLGFMVDTISRFLHVIDSVGERRHATDLRLMRGGSLIAPGLLQLARDDLARSMDDARAIADTVLEFYSAFNLAQALYASGDPTAAFRPARRGIELARTLSPAEQAAGIALEGDVLAGQGKWREAGVKYDSSARLAAKASYAGGEAHALELQGSMAMRLGEWSMADSLLRLAAYTVTRGGYGGNAAQLNYLLASVAIRRGRLAEARQRLRESEKGAVGEGNLLYSIKAREAEIRWREGDLIGASDLLRQAADAMDRYRGTLTRREVRLTAFESSPDDTDPDAGVATIIAALVRERRVREALEFIERGRARELRDRLAWPNTGPTRALEALLPETAAFIEFVVGRGGEPTSVFVITRGNLRGHVTSPVDSMEEPIARLRATLEGNGDARALAASLGGMLLGDAVSELPTSVTTLILSADGALHRVPFDVLRLPDGRFVFERFATSVVPSAAVLIALLNDDPRRVPEGIVAVGGAAYATSGPDAPSPLPWADREAAMVARLSDASTVLRGREATITAFASAVIVPRQLIHIATHARADEYGAVDGALFLAADSASNGVLSASQLLDMKVNADLVVLSACRSGIGQLLRGEGMQSLTAPFLAGGTRSLLATMWLVGDRSTVPLVTDFYRELAAGHPVAEALRRARMSAWQRGAPPREWAAFVAVGNPMVRVPLQAPASGRWRWIAVAVLVTAILAHGVQARRRCAR